MQQLRGQASTPSCAVSQLGLTPPAGVGPYSGYRIESMLLTNVSTATCALSAPPTVTLHLASGGTMTSVAGANSGVGTRSRSWTGCYPRDRGTGQLRILVSSSTGIASQRHAAGRGIAAYPAGSPARRPLRSPSGSPLLPTGAGHKAIERRAGASGNSQRPVLGLGGHDLQVHGDPDKPDVHVDQPAPLPQLHRGTDGGPGHPQQPDIPPQLSARGAAGPGCQRLLSDALPHPRRALPRNREVLVGDAGSRRPSGGASPPAVIGASGAYPAAARTQWTSNRYRSTLRAQLRDLLPVW